MNKAAIPSSLHAIPAEYLNASIHPGKLEKLEYTTFDSLTYAQHKQKIRKNAWVYVPFGYDPRKKYSVVYMSHGGWSDETTLLGTEEDPHPLKLYIDHAIEEGKIRPVLIVALTYNNKTDHDSWDYELAIRLTDNYHNELVNDLMPAVESKYSTYASEISREGFMNSRDHRAFAGFSMGSVNTWRTFQYCLDYFRYFSPMSGNLTSDGEAMADIVRNSKWNWNDFFILSASGSNDFARNAFVQQISNMADVRDHTFRCADNEEEGNLFYREWKGGAHDPQACDQYTLNNLEWITERMEERE